MLDSELEEHKVSELALASASLEEFWRLLVEHLQRVVGFDTACLAWLVPGICRVTAVGYDEAQVGARLPLYMSEFSSAELAVFAGVRPVVDDQVVSACRRPELTVYRELLSPLGVCRFTTNISRWRDNVFGFHFGRSGTICSFRSSELDRLERLMPSMLLGQALHATKLLGDARLEQRSEWWEQGWRLSPGELVTARLAQRGLRNSEIADLIHVSRNTVRNRLASIFRKAHVSTRAELVFAMSSEEPYPVNGTARQVVNGTPWESFLNGESL